MLNAKFHELEAEIVAQAGQHGAVTIATNMAGRGTDIKLDDASREAGGLKIIGTERHESRRIDNQLRGRSGRQGDPGESRFYISLEDDLMRLFGSETVSYTHLFPNTLLAAQYRPGSAFCGSASTGSGRRRLCYSSGTGCICSTLLLLCAQAF